MIKLWPGCDDERIDLVLAVPTEPKGKPRPRFTSYGAPYTPIEFVDWSRDLSIALGEQLGTTRFQGPVRLDAVFVLPRPEYMTKVYARTGVSKYPAGLIPHIQKPDRDNFDKALLDALQFGVQYHQWYSHALHEAELPYLLEREEENEHRKAAKKKPLTKDPFPKALQDKLFEKFLETQDPVWRDDAVVWCGSIFKVFCELDDSGPLPLSGKPRILVRLRNEIPDVDAEVDRLLFSQS